MIDNFPYEDMLHLPHPVSRRHPPMSLEERAVQFAAFAALGGFEEGERTKRDGLAEACPERTLQEKPRR